MRVFFLAALLLFPGFLMAQWTPGMVVANVVDYTGIPHQEPALVQKNKISIMHFYMVKKEAFDRFTADTAQVPALPEKSEGWRLDFDKQGRVFIAEYKTLTEQTYWYTYDKQGRCSRVESYREGKPMWQSQNLMKYDGTDHLLQQKITLTDYNSGKPDQAEQFVYKWKDDYQHLYCGYKVTLDRGKTVKGNSTSKRIYSMDSSGHDTLLVKKELIKGEWKESRQRTVYTRDAQGRITGRKTSSDKFTDTESWEYDAQGRLIMHSKTIPGSDVVPRQKFYYHSNGLLSAIYFYNGFSEDYMIIRYDRFLDQ